MISRIKAGMLSCIGLIIVNILKGIFLIPNFNISNPIIFAVIVQIGFLWFSISLWISMKYVLVNLHNLSILGNNLKWIISNLAIIGGLGLINVIFPLKELYLVIYILAIILLVNYIILFVQIYRLDDMDLKNVNDLHNFLISMIVLIIIGTILTIMNEFFWHREIKYINGFLSAIPFLFLIWFFKHEKLDIQKQINASALQRV